MSVGEEQTQSERVFGTDEEVVSYSLAEFKKLQAVFVQEVIDVEGGVVFGKRHFFQERAEMTMWLWQIPGNQKYIAVAVSPTEQVLTYRGNKFVVAYENITKKPEVDFYKSFSRLPKVKISDRALKESVSEMIRQLKSA